MFCLPALTRRPIGVVHVPVLSCGQVVVSKIVPDFPVALLAPVLVQMVTVSVRVFLSTHVALATLAVVFLHATV